MNAQETHIYNERMKVLSMIIDLSFDLTSPIALRVGVVPGVTCKNAIDLRDEVRKLIEARLRAYAEPYLGEYGK